MDTLSEILAHAQQRAQSQKLDYEGVLTPEEAWQVMQLAPAAKLVDVRSYAELDLVGRIPGASHIEWAFYPGWEPNPDFLSQLKIQVDPESLVMFLCRTGVRSDKAANAAHKTGYNEAYNVQQGFEGETDQQAGQRGGINGWKAAGLPWTNV
jgi:rhodanese-related sulfurtransferase